MKTRKGMILFAWFMAVGSLVFSMSTETDVERIRAETQATLSSQKTTRMEFDRNKDGKTDHVMFLDEKGRKLYEELDYNYDGKMDDLCFYSNGTLQKELVDTNFDGKIDLWVYLRNGVYVERYERDTDYDGVVDKVKQFGQKK